MNKQRYKILRLSFLTLWFGGTFLFNPGLLNAQAAKVKLKQGNKSKIPSTQLLIKNEAEKINLLAFPWFDGSRLGYWDLTVPLKKIQNRVYLENKRYKGFISKALQSKDRLTFLWGLNNLSKYIKHFNRSSTGQISENRENIEEYIIIQFKNIDKNYIFTFIDLLREENWFSSIKIKNEALKVLPKHSSWILKRTIDSIVEMKSLVSKEPLISTDPKLIDFVLENQESPRFNKNFKPFLAFKEFTDSLEIEIAFAKYDVDYLNDIDKKRIQKSGLESYINYYHITNKDYFYIQPITKYLNERKKYNSGSENSLINYKNFLNGNSFHPGWNDIFLRMIKINDNIDYVSKMENYNMILSAYDPDDSILLSAKALIQYNIYLQTTEKLLNLHHLEKSAKDIRFRLLASLALGNRYFIDGKYSVAKRYYLKSSKLVKLLYAKTKIIYLGTPFENSFANLQKEIDLILLEIKKIYPLYRGYLEASDSNKYGFLYNLGKYFYHNLAWQKLPGFDAENIFNHYGFYSPGLIKNRYYFAKMTKPFIAWRYFYHSAETSDKNLKVKSVYSSAVCLNRLSFPLFNPHRLKPYRDTYWKKLSKQYMHYIIDKFPEHTLSKYARSIFNTY